MDRNENGFPRVGNQNASGGRDCTGNMKNSPSANGSINGNNGAAPNGKMGENGSNDMPGCGPQGRDGGCADCLDSKPLAYSYTPIQRWQMLYTVDKGLERGTLFEELDKPSGVYGNE